MIIIKNIFMNSSNTPQIHTQMFKYNNSKYYKNIDETVPRYLISEPVIDSHNQVLSISEQHLHA